MPASWGMTCRPLRFYKVCSSLFLVWHVAVTFHLPGGLFPGDLMTKPMVPVTCWPLWSSVGLWPHSGDSCCRRHLDPSPACSSPGPPSIIAPPALPSPCHLASIYLGLKQPDLRHEERACCDFGDDRVTWQYYGNTLHKTSPMPTSQTGH